MVAWVAHRGWRGWHVVSQSTSSIVALFEVDASFPLCTPVNRLQAVKSVVGKQHLACELASAFYMLRPVLENDALNLCSSAMI